MTIFTLLFKKNKLNQLFVSLEVLFNIFVFLQKSSVVPAVGGCWWLLQVPEHTVAPINEEYENSKLCVVILFCYIAEFYPTEYSFSLNITIQGGQG